MKQIWQNVHYWIQVVGIWMFMCYYSLHFFVYLKFFIIKHFKKLNGFDTTLNRHVRAKYLPLLNSQNFQHQEQSLALKGKIIYECGLHILRTICIWILWHLTIIYYLNPQNSVLTLSFSLPFAFIFPFWTRENFEREAW